MGPGIFPVSKMTVDDRQINMVQAPQVNRINRIQQIQALKEMKQLME